MRAAIHILLVLSLVGCKTTTSGPDCWKGTRNTNCTVSTIGDLTDVCSGWIEVTGNLYVNATSLADLDGLECLETVGAAVAIQHNASLENTAGLSNLTTVSGAINIDDNASLANLDLSSLTTVGSYMQIMDDPSLTNLDSLFSLTSVGGDLLINSNDNLTSIEGLSALTSVGGANVIIMSNPRLPTCQAQALEDRLVASGYPGTVIIAHNDDTATCD